ncbi:MAG: hypothetical protein IJH53_02750 [Oscillospiraceae bacterium]|nr:hypothetical protein [Oscillospiraceae bacterium]
MKKMKILKKKDQNRELEQVAQSFFETDEEKKIAKMVLKYEKTEDLFDPACCLLKPIVSREVLAHIGSMFGLVPNDYKVDLTLRFNDLCGYSESQLVEIIRKNFALEMRGSRTQNKSRRNLAFSFIGIGVLFFLIMIIIKRFWVADTVWNDLVFYFFDILTTVAFYQAATILVVEHREKKAIVNSMRNHFHELIIEKSA